MDGPSRRHPISWHQEFDGGRSFFTTLGHTKTIYGNELYRTHVLGGIKWAAGAAEDFDFTPIAKNLILDLNADKSVMVENGDREVRWDNQVASNPAKEFVQQDEGRNVPGSGRPSFKLQAPEIRHHNTIVFNRQELVNHDEDAFDHLLTGSGYTWFAVIIADQKLEENRYHLIVGRMGTGTGEVTLELFMNDVAQPAASGLFPVNPSANSSKMAIGQERDATNHPGKESFDGEIARFLIYDRPLTDDEIAERGEN